MSLKSALRVSVAVVGTSLAAPAVTGPVYENASGGTFTFYGHFNPAYVSFDDGVDSTSEFADNAASESRVGMYITQAFGQSEFRFHFETGLGLRPTNGLSQTFTPKFFDWDRTEIRHVDFRLKTASYGSFYAGQDSMASDGIGDRDLSGTGLVTAISISDVAGGFQFRDGVNALSGVTIGDAFDSFDGSRRGRVRYDSPTFAGFTVGVAYGEDILTSGNDDEFWDVALGYETELANGTQIEAGLGYQVRQRSGSQDREDTFGSFTVLLPSGFNVSVAAGDRNTGGNYYYGKIGYIARVLPFGDTAMSIDYYSGSDFETVGDSSDSWGIGIVQDFDAQNIEAYLGYRDYAYSDTAAVSYQDASSIIFGTRWRF